MKKADDERYRQKLLLKSEVIIEAANRLWGESLRACRDRQANNLSAREQQFDLEDDM